MNEDKRDQKSRQGKLTCRQTSEELTDADMMAVAEGRKAGRQRRAARNRKETFELK